MVKCRANLLYVGLSRKKWHLPLYMYNLPSPKRDAALLVEMCSLRLDTPCEMVLFNNKSVFYVFADQPESDIILRSLIFLQMA